MTARASASSGRKYGVATQRRLCAAKAEYARRRLLGIAGVTQRFAAPVFNEFVLDFPRPAGDVVNILIERGFAVGFPLGRYYKGMDNAILMAVTEKRIQSTKQQLIRKNMGDVIAAAAKEKTLGEFIKMMLGGELASAVFKSCKPIYPIKRVEIFKSEVLFEPQEVVDAETEEALTAVEEEPEEEEPETPEEPKEEKEEPPKEAEPEKKKAPKAKAKKKDTPAEAEPKAE